jgi:hippurate hydrolase
VEICKGIHRNPGRVYGDLRLVDRQVREEMISSIRSIKSSIATACRMPGDRLPTMAMKGHSSALVNDPRLTERLDVPLKALLGAKHVVTEIPPAAGAEDAHRLLGDHSEVPVAFPEVGIAVPALFAKARNEAEAVPFAAHNPNLRADLAAIPLGAGVERYSR